MTDHNHDKWIKEEVNLRKEIIKYQNDVIKNKVNILVFGQKNAEKTATINTFLNVLIHNKEDFDSKGVVSYIDPNIEGYKEYNIKQIAGETQPYNISFYDTDENDYTNLTEELKNGIKFAILGRLNTGQKLADSISWFPKQKDPDHYSDFCLFITRSDMENKHKIKYPIHLTVGGNLHLVTTNNNQDSGLRTEESIDNNFALTTSKSRCSLLQLILDLTTLSIGSTYQRYDPKNARNSIEYPTCNLL